jgi:hypothetical protein
MEALRRKHTMQKELDKVEEMLLLEMQVNSLSGEPPNVQTQAAMTTASEVLRIIEKGMFVALFLL